MEIVDGGLQSDSSSGPFGDPLEDLGDGRRLRDAREFGRQILLQRLACGFGAALEACVDFGGKVSNQHVRHACIMLASGPGSQVDPGDHRCESQYAHIRAVSGEMLRFRPGRPTT